MRSIDVLARGGSNGDRGQRNGEFQQNFRERDGDGDSARRGRFGDRGGQRGGRSPSPPASHLTIPCLSDRDTFRDRGGSRGGRGGFHAPSDTNEVPKTFGGWSDFKSSPSSFEAGERFADNELPKGPVQFVLSHLETGNDFFIQLLTKATELSSLSETLQKDFKDAPALASHAMKVDQACLAKSTDDCWYRARILTTGIAKVKVRFVDFGDTLDVDTRFVRQLAKKHCSIAPYAFRCTFEHLQVNDSLPITKLIDHCAEKQFDGSIKSKSIDEKYLLQSANLEKCLVEIDAVHPRADQSVKRVKCLIVHTDFDQRLFYVQDDDKAMDEIRGLVEQEADVAKELAADDVRLNSIVISTYEDAPYRAMVQSESDENANVYFIDYGNTNTCLKTTLKPCSERLQGYAHQAKRCRLFGVPSHELDRALKELEAQADSDETEILVVNQEENVHEVRVFVNGQCLNGKFGFVEKNETSGETDEQSSTATTVREQERTTCATGKRNNDEIASPVGNSVNPSTNAKRKKSVSDIETNPPKYHQGTLTHVDKTKPFVYIQLLPDCESNMDRINELIAKIVEQGQHNDSYQIGDHIIAQFNEDDNHYRARIESYSSSDQTYSVYFLDYGNVDDQVREDRLFSYSDDLKQIEPQAHGYFLENVTFQTWTSTVRSLVEAQKLNETVEFEFIDENKSIIHIQFDDDTRIYNAEKNKPKTFTANISGTNKDCFYIHILPEADSLICEMDELLQNHVKEHRTDAWSIDDRCMVFDSEQNQYFRGQILSMDDGRYDVQCIDYGNVMRGLAAEHLYLLTNDDLVKQPALARQCRLYGVNDDNQSKAVDELLQHVEPSERVTITVENDQNDQCMSVMLFRENNEIVNDQYQFDDHVKVRKTCSIEFNDGKGNVSQCYSFESIRRERDSINFS